MAKSEGVIRNTQIVLHFPPRNLEKQPLTPTSAYDLLYHLKKDISHNRQNNLPIPSKHAVHPSNHRP